MMLFLGMGVPKNDVEGAARLIACDPGVFLTGGQTTIRWSDPRMVV
jgi:hypothetical protein